MRAPREVVTELSDRIDAVVGALLPPGSRVALLDFPNHNNVGDNSIWLGEKACLRRLGLRLVYQCDLAGYCRERLEESLGDGGVILLHGGGNLGDVWPRHQLFRERVVSEFRHRPIVQMPQTVFFADPGAAGRARSRFAEHPDFKVLVRDRRSLVFARENLGLRAELCPDMAFAIGPLERPAAPVLDVVWLARTDHESWRPPTLETGNGGVEVLDWLVGEPGRFWSPTQARITVRIRRSVNRLLAGSRSLRRSLAHHVAASFDTLAARRLRRGLRILSRGRVVISDRLHGHILSLLLGIPHVMLDNHYGKLRDYHEAFTHDCLGVRRETDPDRALAAARELLRDAA